MKHASQAAAPALAIAALAVLAGGALLVCPESNCTAPAFDVAGLELANAWRSNGFDRAFLALTWLGSLYLLLPAALGLAWRARRTTAQHNAVFVPAALLGAAVLARLAKLAIVRPRPELFPPLIAMPDDASFPSAHAMQATAFAVAWLLRPGARPLPGEILAACLLIAAVATSRVYLQVHYPSDVAFGIAAASLWVLALRLLPLWNKDAA